MPIRLDQLLKMIPADTEERVDRTRERINTTAREAMRRETGLLLNRRDSKDSGGRKQEMINVPVRLKAGLPTPVKDLTFEDEHWLAVMVSPYRSYLVQSDKGLEGLARLIADLVKEERGRSVLGGREVHIPPIQELVKELRAQVDRFDPVKRILEVNEDVLGVYRYRLPSENQLFPTDPFKGTIELYWGVIGLIAGMLGVSIESLTAVCLAHELAHAYTHLGADIDGERWASDGFSKSDHPLKEGLAQYYTHLVGGRLGVQVQGTVSTYEQLMEHQPEAYKTHVSWVEKFTPEEIRLAMLEVRRSGVGICDDFDSGLKQARKRLRRNESE